MRHFFDLTGQEQTELLVHFINEGFAIDFVEALNECAQLEGEDLELHLDAAINGYI